MTNAFQLDVFLSNSARAKMVGRDFAARLNNDGLLMCLDEEKIQLDCK